ncbi:hypothetical protein [Saccharothrix violaceirubra]|uniref:Putative HAF family extracellular repeat protein n=1 Tax=Saccharothrix violaceirubra TaxID=413306 RepID=A0A7W7WW11_9PSEU|nr:hypothetical protein [Saccharothrix violaceirubra]MBB4965900.1 putative HAF family extracellular repeat protein [Saccharothrix violaceirubra]
MTGHVGVVVCVSALLVAADDATGIVDLGLGHAAAIDDRGTVVGWDGSGRAVRWDVSGRKTVLDVLPGHTTSWASDIDRHGNVVGTSARRDAEGRTLARHAVRWDRDGRVFRLAGLDGRPVGTAVAVDEDGVAVGTASGPDTGVRAVRWDQARSGDRPRRPAGVRVVDARRHRRRCGRRQRLHGGDGVAGGPVGRRRADRRPGCPAGRRPERCLVRRPGRYGGRVLDRCRVRASCGVGSGRARHRVVGPARRCARVAGGDRRRRHRRRRLHHGDDRGVRAVRWDRHGRVTGLSTPPGVGSTAATAIGDRGVIVGYGWVDDRTTHALRWDRDGRVVDLGLLPDGTYSTASRVNGRGVVIGQAGKADGDHAVLWRTR